MNTQDFLIDGIEWFGKSVKNIRINDWTDLCVQIRNLSNCGLNITPAIDAKTHGRGNVWDPELEIDYETAEDKANLTGFCGQLQFPSSRKSPKETIKDHVTWSVNPTNLEINDFLNRTINFDEVRLTITAG